MARENRIRHVQNENTSSAGICKDMHQNLARLTSPYKKNVKMWKNDVYFRKCLSIQSNVALICVASTNDACDVVNKDGRENPKYAKCGNQRRGDGEGNDKVQIDEISVRTADCKCQREGLYASRKVDFTESYNEGDEYNIWV